MGFLEMFGSFVGGNLVGVLVDKVVGDACKKAGWPMPWIATIDPHDLILQTATGLGAYFAYRKHMELVSMFLTGMFSAVTGTQLYDFVRQYTLFGQTATASTTPTSFRTRRARLEELRAK
jgi:hypothetical protein